MVVLARSLAGAIELHHHTPLLNLKLLVANLRVSGWPPHSGHDCGGEMSTTSQQKLLSRAPSAVIRLPPSLAVSCDSPLQKLKKAKQKKILKTAARRQMRVLGVLCISALAVGGSAAFAPSRVLSLRNGQRASLCGRGGSRNLAKLSMVATPPKVAYCISSDLAVS